MVTQTNRLDITVNPRQLKRVRAMLAAVPNGMGRVMSRAINRTATGARSQAVKAIAAESGLQQKTIRQKVTILRANMRHWAATIRIRDTRVPMITLGAKQTKRGVTVRDKAGGGRRLIASAFIATMPSGHTGVFKRRGAKRLPIAEQMTDSLARYFEETAGLAGRILAASEERLSREIDSQVAVILDKFKQRQAG